MPVLYSVYVADEFDAEVSPRMTDIQVWHVQTYSDGMFSFFKSQGIKPLRQ